MQQIGTVPLPPTGICVATMLGMNLDQPVVQAMYPGGEKESANARSRGHTPVEEEGIAGMNDAESRQDGRRRCAGEDRQAVIGL